MSGPSFSAFGPSTVARYTTRQRPSASRSIACRTRTTTPASSIGVSSSKPSGLTWTSRNASGSSPGIFIRALVPAANGPSSSTHSVPAFHSGQRAVSAKNALMTSGVASISVLYSADHIALTSPWASDKRTYDLRTYVICQGAMAAGSSSDVCSCQSREHGLDILPSVRRNQRPQEADQRIVVEQLALCPRSVGPVGATLRDRSRACLCNDLVDACEERRGAATQRLPSSPCRPRQTERIERAVELHRQRDAYFVDEWPSRQVARLGGLGHGRLDPRLGCIEVAQADVDEAQDHRPIGCPAPVALLEMNPPTLGRPRASFSEIAGTQLDGSADQRRVGEPLELAGCREQVGALVEPTPRTIEIASEHRHEATVVEVVPESIRQAQASIEIERAVVVGLRGGEVV